MKTTVRRAANLLEIKSHAVSGRRCAHGAKRRSYVVSNGGVTPLSIGLNK